MMETPIDTSCTVEHSPPEFPVHVIPGREIEAGMLGFAILICLLGIAGVLGPRKRG